MVPLRVCLKPLSIAVCMYVFMLLIFTRSLPRNLDPLNIYQAGVSKHASVSNATYSSKYSPSPPTSHASRALTFCAMRQTKKDFVVVNISLDVYFRLLPDIVTEVVEVFLEEPHSDFCGGALDLLFLVPSSPTRGDYRQVIRETWGSRSWPGQSYKEAVKTAVLFVMARPAASKNEWNNNNDQVNNTDGKDDEQLLASLQAEARLYGDVLLIDAQDGYRQMTVKMLAGLQWLSRRCHNVTYVARVDEDHFLNVPLYFRRIHSWFQGHPQLANMSIVGKILCTRTSVVHRTNLSKHFVEFKDYPYDYYPTYLGGGTYVMSAMLVPRLVHAARHFPSFTVDDAYITGVLVRVLDLLLVNLPFILMEEQELAFLTSCGLSKHGANPEVMRKIWGMLHLPEQQQQQQKCRGRSNNNLNTCASFCSTTGITWAP